MRARGLRPLGSEVSSCASELPHVAFQPCSRCRPSALCVFSGSVARPASAPVNASPMPLRTSTHDSGSYVVRYSFIVRTFTLTSYRFYRRTSIITCDGSHKTRLARGGFHKLLAMSASGIGTQLPCTKRLSIAVRLRIGLFAPATRRSSEHPARAGKGSSASPGPRSKERSADCGLAGP